MKKIAFTDEEIVQAFDRVKVSKGDGGAMQVLYGTVGSKPSQSGHQVFLPDTGASINIIPEQTSKENGITIVKFDKPGLVASGNMLNIVGEAILVFGNIWGKAK